MKRALLAVLGLTFATTVYAACTTHTITTADGRMIMCTTCCYGPNNCYTNCF